MLTDLLHRLDAAARDTAGAQGFDPLRRSLLQQHRFQYGAQRVGVLDSIRVGAETRVFRQIPQPCHLAEAAPQRIIAAAEVKVAVFALKGFVRDDGGVAVAGSRRAVAGGEVDAGLIGE